MNLNTISLEQDKFLTFIHYSTDRDKAVNTIKIKFLSLHFLVRTYHPPNSVKVLMANWCAHIKHKNINKYIPVNVLSANRSNKLLFPTPAAHSIVDISI